jgi:leukotriene-A4 hydrolase
LQSRAALSVSHIERLGELYGLDKTGNIELRFRFYQLALGDAKSDAAREFAPIAVNWVAGTDGSGVVKGRCPPLRVIRCVLSISAGRMKFCRPIFRAVHAVNPDLAREVFSKSKEAFHPIARRLIEKVS